MSLKAVLFDFNGVIINDESIHQQLTEQILLEENMVLNKGEYQQICWGRSDVLDNSFGERSCLRDLLATRGRVVSEEYLTQLLNRKAQAYVQELEKMEKLPIYPGLADVIFQMRSRQLKLGLVSGAIRQEIELVLQRTQLAEYFSVVLADDDITTSKPEPNRYLLAVERLNQQYPDLNLQPQECLVIEDTLAGITAAKHSQMRVVGVAHTYPFHMLQRCCNWTVDYLHDLELDRVQEVFSRKELQPTTVE
jgi:beta-phosphoglucomutase